jgi:hypothetical protein
MLCKGHLYIHITCTQETSTPLKTICSNTAVLDLDYSSFKSSSVWLNAALGDKFNNGKLDSPQAWSASTNDMYQWMEINTVQIQPIAGIVTQGA